MYTLTEKYIMFNLYEKKLNIFGEFLFMQNKTKSVLNEECEAFHAVHHAYNNNKDDVI